ncbi:OmpH family outer membrane protein [Novosphingobium sp.]|jgi:Skp family chaperone for outer membrane proteins|uniref:OmpH family outer membrane protein n=1 Tax=Novosphingobium sp. TaxID=1874826 RepID=UPI002FDD2A2C
MKLRIASALIAGLMISAAPAAMAQQKAAAAPASTGPVANGVAFANPSAIVGSSAAYQTAQQQRPTTYKSQIDQANTRSQQINAQLKPLADKFQADQKNPKADRAALQAQLEQIQQIQEDGKREIQQILAPLSLSEQYVIEQISDKLADATQRAMTKRRATIVLDVQSVVKADPSSNISQDILTELNALIPSAQLVPPAGWMPRAEREAQAQQQAAQGQQAPAAANNTKAPQGR